MDNQLLSKRPRCGYGFIYCYTSPSGKKYIGQTRTTLKERAKTTNYSGYKNCIAFYNAIQKYGITNFEIEIIAECPLDVINSEEEKYISLYDSTNPNKGYNIDDGRKQMIALVNRIPVFEYDGITGNFIREFSSINEASRYYGCYRTSIERAVNGTHAQRSQGNLWRTYKVDQISPALPDDYEKQPCAKLIYMYDSITGQYLREFDSVREASRITGVSRPTIQSHISEKVKIGKNYTFKLYKVDNLFLESSTTISQESRG